MPPFSSIYQDKDLSLEPLTGRKVGIIGYGNQGRAHALNLAESGVKVTVGLRKNSPSRGIAEKDDIAVKNIEECAADSDVTMLLLPDEVHRDVYKDEVAPNLVKGKALGFAHGISITSQDVLPQEGIDVFLVAPSAPGAILRKSFIDGNGVPALFAVHKDYTGEAKELALAYGKAIGCGKSCLIETTFEEETAVDLFGEQVVVCGGVSALITGAYETLVDKGYSPQVAYIECLHQLRLTVDLIYREGISGMRKKISSVALYGDLTRGPRVIDASVKERMGEILAEIESGRFFRELREEEKKGGMHLKNLKRKADKHDIEKVGAQLRSILF